MADDARLLSVVRVLASHEVEYLLVGGLAAVLHGAPIVTDDIDVLHRRTEQNVARLVEALRELGAVYRGDPRRLTPKTSHLIGQAHNLLETRSCGPLDVLGTIGSGTTYDDLVASSQVFELDDVTVRVVGLRQLILSKEQAGRAKDLAVLPVLRATLEESE